MRLNQFIAHATGLSRRQADEAISRGRVRVDGHPAQLGQQITEAAKVTLDSKAITPLVKTVTIMLNKPVGYVCSRRGQGSKTIYDLLAPKYHSLKPVGRLDKDSSGLLLLTNDGRLAHELTHPRFEKSKVYEIELNRPLKPEHKKTIEQGVELEDGISSLNLKGGGKSWIVTMHEGRNRQIRRTFEIVGYKIAKLHRIKFGEYELKNLPKDLLYSTVS